MSLYDRDYTQERFQSDSHYVPQLRFGLPVLTPAVKTLLIINVVVFLVCLIIRPAGAFLYNWFQFDATSTLRLLQFWRLVTYQFLHGSFEHILFNMLGLYFLGPTLEQHWGTKRFTAFYLGCGVAGAIFYLFLVVVNFLLPAAMIGASGAILGVFAACAILFPHIVVFILLFPVPIRLAAFIFTVIYIVAVLTKQGNAGGDAAHLAGMAAGALYVLSQPWRTRIKLKLRAMRWAKKAAAYQKLQAEVDRILQKVHDHGIHSLTSGEKKTLKKATKTEQMRNGSFLQF